MNGLTPSKIDARYAESKVLFSISDCTTAKNYSFWCLDRTQAEDLLKRLRYFEQLEWRQFGALDREHGLSVEKPDSESFKMIHEQNSSPEKLIEQYYFHFRVEQKGLFRVFGYQKGRLFCITHIDPGGKIHHS